MSSVFCFVLSSSRLQLFWKRLPELFPRARVCQPVHQSTFVFIMPASCKVLKLILMPPSILRPIKRPFSSYLGELGPVQESGGCFGLGAGDNGSPRLHSAGSWHYQSANIRTLPRRPRGSANGARLRMWRLCPTLCWAGDPSRALPSLLPTSRCLATLMEPGVVPRGQLPRTLRGKGKPDARLAFVV